VRGVKIHAALLGIVVLLALPTWTRGPVREPSGIALWNRDADDVTAIRYRSAAREVNVERRTEGGETFLWGQEVVREDTSAASDTLEFPVGAYAGRLLEGFAALRVVRALGAVTPEREQELGLVEPGARITVDLTDGPRELVVGDSVYGGSDRYALDTSSGTILVLPADLIGPLRLGSAALRERQVHRFSSDDVALVRVSADRRQREALRSAAGASSPVRWAEPDSPDRPDVTFANFMERVSQLAIEGYEPGVDIRALQTVTRLEYFDAEDALLGFVELFRDPSAASPRYYLLSERTRIPAAAITLLAERVEQAVTGIF
jgi:hypothetical protein